MCNSNVIGSNIFYSINSKLACRQHMKRTTVYRPTHVLIYLYSQTLVNMFHLLRLTQIHMWLCSLVCPAPVCITDAYPECLVTGRWDQYGRHAGLWPWTSVVKIALTYTVQNNCTKIDGWIWGCTALRIHTTAAAEGSVPCFRACQQKMLREKCYSFSNSGQTNKQIGLKSLALARYTSTSGQRFCMGIINVRSAVVDCYLGWGWQGSSHWLPPWVNCCLPHRNELSGNSAWQK